LAELLKERGVNAKILLPSGLQSLRKHDIESFTALPVVQRLRLTWSVIQALDRAIAEPGAVLHIVLPSPAFSWVTHFIRFPRERIVLHYEGAALRCNRPHLQVALEDPALMLPRMLLGHQALSRLGRGLACAHLATNAVVAKQLRSFGFRRIYEIPNVSTFQADDKEPTASLPELSNPAHCHLAYIGHAHPVKGIDDLLTAFAMACEWRPELRLLLALSSDGKAARIRRRVSNLGLDDKVTIAGLLPIQTVLRCIDALVLPYRSAVTTTIYPSLLLEANNAQCPIITTAIREWANILHADSCCLQIVPPRSVEQLAKALLHVPRRMPQRWEAILNLPETEDIMQQMLALYEGLIAGRRQYDE
jgi:glycosyltransferase involved in cell wall biosynthesis